MTRAWRALGALVVATVAFSPAAFAQIGPLPPPPEELEPVTGVLPPLGEPACGTIDGTLPTAAIELLGPWIVLLCPVLPTPEPPPEPPVEESPEPVIAPSPPVFVPVEILPRLAPPIPADNVVAPRPRQRTVPPAPAPARRPPLPSSLVSAPSGFEYRVIFLLPLALLALGGYSGWVLNRPVTSSGK